MTNKQKIEILKEYRDLVHELDILMESYLVLRAKLTAAKIPQLKQDVIQCSMTDKQSDDLAEMLDLEQMIATRRLDIINARRRIERAILGIENSTHRMLINLKYCDGLTWEKICVEMSYSWKQIHRLHSDALNQIEFYQLQNR